MPSPICRQVIVIGLDGATFDLIKPWTDQGKLPTLARLMEVGAWGDLVSTIPPHSPAAWSTFATGLNPGKHGIIDFRKRKIGTYETPLINGQHRSGQPIWKILSDYQKTVGVVNIPITYPPEPVHGCFISGMDTPDGATNYTYPASLASELTTQIGDYIVGLPWIDDVRQGHYAEIWDKINRALDKHIETVRYLLVTYSFDFFVVNFSATDAVQHHFWRFMDPTHPQYETAGAAKYGSCIYKIYKKLDDYLAEVWSNLGQEATLLVISDHGFGPVGRKAVYLNKWLEQQNFLKLKNKNQRTLWRRFVPHIVKQVGQKLVPHLYNKARSPFSPYFIDWSQTRAFADEYQECIWLNLIGRDPEGIVQPGDEYESLRSQIIEGLMSLVDPETGVPVIEKVYRREELYHGPQLETLPDLYVEQRWKPFFRLRPSHTSTDPSPIRTLTPTEIMADHLPGGVHRPNGIFLATGNCINPGRDLLNLKLIDVPATILYLLGVPLPTNFDGRVLHEIVHCSAPVEYTSEYSQNETFSDQEIDVTYNNQEEQAVMERLRGLGYVD